MDVGLLGLLQIVLAGFSSEKAIRLGGPMADAFEAAIGPLPEFFLDGVGVVNELVNF